MLLHTIVDPMAVMEQPSPPLAGFWQISPFCSCEWVGDGESRQIRRIVSTDLGSYLDPRLQPGMTAMLKQQEPGGL